MIQQFDFENLRSFAQLTGTVVSARWAMDSHSHAERVADRVMKLKKVRRHCMHCGRLFQPSPRLGKRQMYCSKSICAAAAASRQAAQRKWTRKRSNRDHFKGKENVERVRTWREAHPTYWRDRRARQRARRARFSIGKSLYGIARKLALQDTIALEIRRPILLGHGILRQSTGTDSSRRQ